MSIHWFMNLILNEKNVIPIGFNTKCLIINKHLDLLIMYKSRLKNVSNISFFKILIRKL